MPFHPAEWVVWKCQTCKSIVNVCPDRDVANRTPRCPYCQFTPEGPIERRAALDIDGVGLIGGGDTAGLDYLASIANSLADIRNKFFAIHHVPDPIDVSYRNCSVCSHSHIPGRPCLVLIGGTGTEERVCGCSHGN